MRPGGFEAAGELAIAGKKIAVIDEAPRGGTCLNTGCIPTKMVLGAAAPGEALALLKKQKEAAGEIRVEYPGLQKGSGVM